MDNIINNIRKSSIPEERKKELIVYAKTLLKNDLPVFFDKRHLTVTLNIPEKSETVAEFVNSETLSYSIEKRSGDLRIVCSPNFNLKEAQRWLLNNILVKIPVSDVAHGFVKNRSILTNACLHVHLEDFWVLKMDIEDFFSSISSTNVQDLFQSIGYNNEVSDVLATLCTYNNCLAQGFPTSPYLANLFLTDFDDKLVSYFREKDFEVTYTRYADDLVFSGIKGRGYTIIIKEIIKFVSDELEKLDLKVNEKKTCIQKKKIKKITGLNVSSDGVSISNKYIKKLNQTIYYCEKYGVVDHLKHVNKENVSNFKGYLFGQAYFIKMIDEYKGAEIIKRLKRLDWI